MEGTFTDKQWMGTKLIKDIAVTSQCRLWVLKTLLWLHSIGSGLSQNTTRNPSRFLQAGECQCVFIGGTVAALWQIWRKKGNKRSRSIIAIREQLSYRESCVVLRKMDEREWLEEMFHIICIPTFLSTLIRFANEQVLTKFSVWPDLVYSGGIRNN